MHKFNFFKLNEASCKLYFSCFVIKIKVIIKHNQNLDKITHTN